MTEPVYRRTKPSWILEKDPPEFAPLAEVIKDHRDKKEKCRLFTECVKYRHESGKSDATVMHRKKQIGF
jgi:hypothetical protein